MIKTKEKTQFELQKTESKVKNSYLAQMPYYVLIGFFMACFFFAMNFINSSDPTLKLLLISKIFSIIVFLLIAVYVTLSYAIKPMRSKINLMICHILLAVYFLVIFIKLVFKIVVYFELSGVIEQAEFIKGLIEFGIAIIVSIAATLFNIFQTIFIAGKTSMQKKLKVSCLIVGIVFFILGSVAIVMIAASNIGVIGATVEYGQCDLDLLTAVFFGSTLIIQMGIFNSFVKVNKTQFSYEVPDPYSMQNYYQQLPPNFVQQPQQTATERLTELAEIYKSGLITEGEYKEARRKVLGI